MSGSVGVGLSIVVNSRTLEQQAATEAITIRHLDEVLVECGTPESFDVLQSQIRRHLRDDPRSGRW